VVVRQVQLGQPAERALERAVDEMEERDLLGQHGDRAGQEAEGVHLPLAEVRHPFLNRRAAHPLVRRGQARAGDVVQRLPHAGGEAQSREPGHFGAGEGYQLLVVLGHGLLDVLGDEYLFADATNAEMRPQAAYNELIRLLREEAMLASCVDLLEWDEETYLPRGGVEHRSEQLALLAGLLHDRGTDPRIGELLGDVEGSRLVADPESSAAVNVREIRKDYSRQRKLPR